MAKQDLKRLILLHVEDEDDDAILLSKACQRAELPAELHRVADVAAAKAYLLGQDTYADRFQHPPPHVIILDLKLPGVDGFEFLKWLRAQTQEAFATLPVLVFTASLSREDKARALSEGASSYFVKPASFEALVQVVELFKQSQNDQLS